MHAPDFWDDQATAPKISSQYSRLKSRHDQYRELASLVEDMEVLLELAVEEGG
jgi:peptide chain release factor 2